jgi:cytochrome b
LASTVATGLVLYGARDGAGPLGRFYSATVAPTGLFVVVADAKSDNAPEGATRSNRKKRRQQTKALKEVHELLANLTLGLVVLHIAGVLWASAVHRENLVRAMITGRKRRDEAHARSIDSATDPEPRAT